MKRRKIILLALVISTGLLLRMVVQTQAKATRTDVDSYEYDCLTHPGIQWLEGQVLHIRDIQHTNVNVSDTPELNGLNTTVADGDINLKTGYALIRGTMSFQPFDIDGTWEGTWTFIGNKGVGFGRAVAHGTGALAGKILFLKVYDAESDGNLEAMCTGIGEPESYVATEGYILDPGN